MWPTQSLNFSNKSIDPLSAITYIVTLYAVVVIVEWNSFSKNGRDM
ncbi:hypothetical protein ACFU39_25030 [Bacillus tropicus]